jgi:cell pole-organizing protein PopZ
MNDAKRPDNDPSMDDILASIRKIISDDEARAQAGGPVKGPSLGAANAPSEELARGTRASPSSNREDVLLLTDLIDEPQPDVAPRPMPIAPQRIDPVSAAEMPQPSFDPVPPAAPAASANADSAIIGAAVAGAASSAFDRLSHAVKQSEPRPATVTEEGPVIGAGGKTLEDLVKELLRPMLKDWLDSNLPPIVERMVEREIVRLTRH